MELSSLKLLPDENGWHTIDLSKIDAWQKEEYISYLSERKDIEWFESARENVIKWREVGI